MNTQGPIRQRALRVLGCLFVLSAMLQPALSQPSNDPQLLQKSGIAAIDHWLDYVRRTGDAKSTVSELAVAQSQLKASYDIFLKQQNFAGASLSAIKIGDIQRLQNQWRQAIAIYQAAIAACATCQPYGLSNQSVVAAGVFRVEARRYERRSRLRP